MAEGENRAEQNVAQLDNNAEYEREIDLTELFYRMLASWKLITLLSVTGAVISLMVTMFLIVPTYQATSTIYVLSRKDSAVNISDLQIGTALTKDYIKVFDMWEVHETVISNLDLPYTYSQIRGMLSINNASDTRMLDISVTSTNPEEAASIANEYANVSCDFIAETMSTEKPNIVSAALVPTRPVSPNKMRNTLLGLGIGFAIATAIVVVRMLSDDKIRSADDITKYTGLYTLATIPYDEAIAKESNGQSHHKKHQKRKSH